MIEARPLSFVIDPFSGSRVAIGAVLPVGVINPEIWLRRLRLPRHRQA